MNRPLAASAALADLLGRPGIEATVVAARPPAAYLRVGRRLLAAEANGGLGLPIAVVVDRLPATEAVIDLATWIPARWWDPSVPTIAPRTERVDELRTVLDRLGPPPGTEVVAAARSGRCDELVGLGPGSTPAGDDLIAGRLVTLHALGRPEAAAALARSLPLDRTTELSAELLRHAASGTASRPVIDLVWALANPSSLCAELDRVLQMGHTSGRWLAEGVAGALAAVDA